MTEVSSYKSIKPASITRDLATGALASTALLLSACSSEPEAQVEVKQVDALVEASRALNEAAQCIKFEVDVPSSSDEFQARDVTDQTINYLLSTSPDYYSFVDRDYKVLREVSCFIETSDGSVLLKADSEVRTELDTDYRFELRGPESTAYLVKDTGDFAEAAFNFAEANWKNYIVEVKERGESIINSWLPNLVADLNSGADWNDALLSPQTLDYGHIYLGHDGFLVTIIRYDVGQVFDQKTHEFRVAVTYENEAGMTVYEAEHSGELAREAYETISSKIAAQNG